MCMAHTLRVTRHTRNVVHHYKSKPYKGYKKNELIQKKKINYAKQV